MSLIVDNLHKTYRGRPVLQGVSMEIEPAQITGLLGSNGAGKTTCFYSIAGLIKPDQGELVLNGQKITALPVHRRARLGIGYLPQEMSIFRKLNVRQNLDAVLELNRSLTPAQRLERRRQLLKDFQIEHLEETRGIAHLMVPTTLYSLLSTLYSLLSTLYSLLFKRLHIPLKNPD